MLGVYCGWPHASLVWVAAATWGGGAIIFLSVYVLRLPLMDLLNGLTHRERLGVYLCYIAIFVSPYLVVRKPPWILSFVALNAPLALLALQQRDWHRLLLNNNLICFGALMAWRLPEWLVWLTLGATGFLWVTMAIADHFAATLERAHQGASGMGWTITGVLARQWLLLALIAGPLVAATLWLGPPVKPFSLSSPIMNLSNPVEYPRSRETWGFWEAVRMGAYIGLLLALMLVVIRYWRQRMAQHAPAPVPPLVDNVARGEIAPAPPAAARPAPPPPDSARGQIFAFFEEFCNSMKQLERPRSDFQTAREYSFTLTDLMPYRAGLERMTGAFEIARYSQAPLTDRDVSDFKSYAEKIRLAAARAYAQKSMSNQEKSA